MAWSGKFELNGNALSTGGQLLACSAARAVQAVEPSTQFSAKRFRLRRQPARSSLNRAGSVLVGEGLRVEAPAGSASPSARLRSTCLQISIKVSAAGNDAVASAQPRRNHGATTAQPRRCAVLRPRATCPTPGRPVLLLRSTLPRALGGSGEGEADLADPCPSPGGSGKGMSRSDVPQCVIKCKQRAAAIHPLARRILAGPSASGLHLAVRSVKLRFPTVIDDC